MSTTGDRPTAIIAGASRAHASAADAARSREVLPAELRREEIMARVAEQGFVRVLELSAELGVSAVTARADLDILEAEGIVRRVHGGAVEARASLAERSFEQSLEKAAVAKRDIGALAASLVFSGQSVLLDVGTTTLAVARALRDRGELRDVTVITNGLSIALELEPCIPRFTVIVTGGSLRPLQHSLVEPLATGILDRVHADVAFIGCNGIDVDYGVSNINLPEAGVKAHMMRVAERSIVVAESSKLGARHLGHIAALGAVDAIITDRGADAEWIASVPESGPRILLAGGAESAPAEGNAAR